MLQAISGRAAAAAAADDDDDDHTHNVRMNAPRGINSAESGTAFDSEYTSLNPLRIYCVCEL